MEAIVRLTALEPVRDPNGLVGWTARFTDDVGQTRIASLGLGHLHDPAAFREAVARQGIRYQSADNSDKAAWQVFIRDLTARSSPVPSPPPRRQR